MLNNSCIPRVSPTRSWYIIFFIHWWIQFPGFSHLSEWITNLISLYSYNRFVTVVKHRSVISNLEIILNSILDLAPDVIALMPEYQPHSRGQIQPLEVSGRPKKAKKAWLVIHSHFLSPTENSLYLRICFWSAAYDLSLGRVHIFISIPRVWHTVCTE